MANNRLILHHRPTGNWIALGKRMGLSWMSVSPVDMDLFFNQCDEAMEELGLSVAEYSDDFELLIEDAKHAPMLADNFRMEPSSDPIARHRIVKTHEDDDAPPIVGRREDRAREGKTHTEFVTLSCGHTVIVGLFEDGRPVPINREELDPNARSCCLNALIEKYGSDAT